MSDNVLLTMFYYSVIAILLTTFIIIGIAIYEYKREKQTKLKQEQKEKNKHTFFVNAVKEYLKYRKQPVFYCYNQIVWLCAMSAYANALEKFVRDSEGLKI